MATTISVNKQTIEQFLLNARRKPFVIPEYQRPLNLHLTLNLYLKTI